MKRWVYCYFGDMPVTPTYDWSETVDEVTIRVRLPGITRRKADIFATEVLVKVVAHPYVLLLDLHAEIDADAGAAFSMPGEVLFRLPKVCPMPSSSKLDQLSTNCLFTIMRRKNGAHGPNWFTADQNWLVRQGESLASIVHTRS